MGCLYRLTSPNGKSYIGISSKSTEARWAKHIEHALGKRENGALYNALRKYGPNTFKIETLAIAHFDYLRELEKRAIRVFETLYPNGYNIALGGEGWIGPRNDDFRAKASIAQKKRYRDPEQRRLLQTYGERARANHAAKCAAKRVEGKAPWQVRKKQSTLKAQLGETRFKQVHSDMVKAALKKPEVREKILACAKERAANPEWRKKISESKKGYKPPPYTGESHQARSEGAKRMWARRKAKNVS